MSKQPSPRMRKVNELVREIVAEEVARLKDPRLGFVTVTGAETAPNLRSCRVFYSSIGGDDTRAALEAAAPRIQAALARQARLKYTPVLAFEVDPAIEQGLRMSRLLDEIREKEEAGDGGAPGSGAQRASGVGPAAMGDEREERT